MQHGERVFIPSVFLVTSQTALRCRNRHMLAYLDMPYRNRTESYVNVLEHVVKSFLFFLFTGHVSDLALEAAGTLTILICNTIVSRLLMKGFFEKAHLGASRGVLPLSVGMAYP